MTISDAHYSPTATWDMSACEGPVDAYLQRGAVYTYSKSGTVLSVADEAPSIRYFCARHVAEWRELFAKDPGMQITLTFVEDYRARHRSCDGESMGP